MQKISETTVPWTNAWLWARPRRPQDSGAARLVQVSRFHQQHAKRQKMRPDESGHPGTKSHPWLMICLLVITSVALNLAWSGIEIFGGWSQRPARNQWWHISWALKDLVNMFYKWSKCTLYIVHTHTHPIKHIHMRSAGRLLHVKDSKELIATQLSRSWFCWHLG